MCKKIGAGIAALDRKHKYEILVGSVYAFLLLMLAIALVASIGSTAVEVEELEVDGHS